SRVSLATGSAEATAGASARSTSSTVMLLPVQSRPNAFKCRTGEKRSAGRIRGKKSLEGVEPGSLSGASEAHEVVGGKWKKRAWLRTARLVVFVGAGAVRRGRRRRRRARVLAGDELRGAHALDVAFHALVVVLAVAVHFLFEPLAALGHHLLGVGE